MLSPDAVERIAPPKAVGLLVPGAGGRVSRAGALAALRRGKVENALLGGTPGGKLLVDVIENAPVGASLPVVYVSLPPPGTHPNTTRYPIAVVGPGYEGLLTSSSTRIPGLVSIADVAPTLVALRDGKTPRIRSTSAADPRGELRALDQRLARAHDDRAWTLALLVLLGFALCAVAPRAAVLAGPAAVTGALLLSFAGATRFWVVLVAFGGLAAGLALLGAAPGRRALPWIVAAFLAGYLVLLAVHPETSSLAVLGPHPDGGGRYFGITNQVETLLLPALLVAVAARPRALAPIAALALVTVGWSRAGADGGGVLVYAAGLVVLALRLRGLALTPRRLALAAAGVVLLALALVGLDAALGGSSHVTHAVGTGPNSLLGELGHRLHLSWASPTSSWHKGVLFLASLTVLAGLGSLKPRRAALDGMLAAIAVSLVVNDSPVDVVGLGALGCVALVRWESVDSRPMRRGALALACLAAAAGLAGCGSKGTVSATPQTVVGTLAQESPGKGVFAAQGCNSCHTYKAAAATGKIGPDLDKLAGYAKTAKQPLAAFTRESIVAPNAYVEKGFPKGVMPATYKSLPKSDLDALVDFLTKPQG